jgi:two-component system, NarL family, response regulator DegU
MFFKSIAIADKECLHRIGLRHVLQKHFQKPEINELQNKKDLFKHLEKHPTDILLIDPKNIDGFQPSDIERIKKTSQNCAVIVISDCQDEQSITNLLQTGINAYLCKNCEEQFIIDALYKIEKKERYLCPNIYNIMVDQFFQNDSNKNMLLTPRELQIVKQIAMGNKGKDISETLFISIHTFRTHRKNIMKKIGVNSTSELILYALNNKIY